MLVQRARSVYWKKWSAKHEYEELKEGAWLEPGVALLREKVKDNWIQEDFLGRWMDAKKECSRLVGRMSIGVKLAT